MLLADGLKWNPAIARIFVGVVVALAWNLPLHRWFVFRGQSKPPASGAGDPERGRLRVGGMGGALDELRLPFRRRARARPLELAARHRQDHPRDFFTEAAPRGLLLGELQLPVRLRRRLVFARPVSRLERGPRRPRKSGRARSRRQPGWNDDGSTPRHLRLRRLERPARRRDRDGREPAHHGPRREPPRPLCRQEAGDRRDGASGDARGAARRRADQLRRQRARALRSDHLRAAQQVRGHRLERRSRLAARARLLLRRHQLQHHARLQDCVADHPHGRV